MFKKRFFIAFLTSGVLAGLLLACTSGNTLRWRQSPDSLQEKQKETATKQEEETDEETEQEKEEQSAQEPKEESKPEAVWHELLSINGNGRKDSETFETKGNQWKIDWSFDGGTGGFFQVLIMKEGSDEPEQVAVTTKETGSNTYQVRESGKFYLQINSANGTWTVKVEDKY